MMKSLYLLLLTTGFTLLIAPSFAQTDNSIEGTWKGFITVPLGNSLAAEFHFIQAGVETKGDLKTRNLNGKDSSDIEIAGVKINGIYHFKETRFIYKMGIACLSVFDLKLISNNDKENLEGRWHGTWALNTCPAAWSGKISLTRTKEPGAETVATQVPETPATSGNEPSRDTQPVEKVQQNDEDGTALVQALSQRKYYALIIGIDNYQDKNIPHLDDPVQDATNLKKVLTTYYTFDPRYITFLANPTRTEIINAFDKLSKEITDTDQLLIFYAGHGVWDDQLNQGYWLPSDASLDSKAQWLSNGTIRDYIGGIKSKHTLLVTDACFSGSIFKVRGVDFVNSKAILEMYKLPSRKAMTSGALKTVPDKSVFVKYLIKDLINNDQPLLSAEQLFQTFKVAVINNSPNGQVPQFGPIAEAGDEGGDFIFLKKGAGK